jgi:hypothetical protein
LAGHTGIDDLGHRAATKSEHRSAAGHGLNHASPSAGARRAKEELMTTKRKARRQALIDKATKDPAYIVDKYLSVAGKYAAHVKRKGK